MDGWFDGWMDAWMHPSVRPWININNHKILLLEIVLYHYLGSLVVQLVERCI